MYTSYTHIYTCTCTHVHAHMSRQGTEKEDPSDSTEESRLARLVSRSSSTAAECMGELGGRDGPQTPKARGPSGTVYLKDTPTGQHENEYEAEAQQAKIKRVRPR